MFSVEVSKKVVVVGIICLLMGLAVGYMIGVSWALNFGTKIAYGLMDRGGINITFNEKMITTALYQYQNNIGGCLFTQK